MILARGRAAPLRFLVAVTLGWVGVRGAIVMGWHPPEVAMRWGPSPGSLLDAMPAAIAAVPVLVATHAVAVLTGSVPSSSPPAAAPVTATEAPPTEDLRMLAVASYTPVAGRFWSRDPASAATATIATPQLPPPDPSRLSGSGWAFLRGGGQAGVSPDGQIGGGQAGVRLLYRIVGGLSAAARVSRAIGGPRQTEAALGLDWKPLPGVPVHLMVDRRIAIDRGGRNAWAAGVAGGAYAVAVARGVRLDGYAQAGVVGARARDLYADGAVRVGREVPLGEQRSLTLGGGVFGAAQPGATRLDAGPGAVMRVPVDHATIAAAVDWRHRVAGGARPGSGPALTVGLDF